LIPYLDQNLLQTNTSSSKNAIVRFVGMVQDILDVEYYHTQVQGRYTKYQEHDDRTDPCHDDLFLESIDSSMDYGERQPLILVPIPFTSPWFQQSLLNHHRQSISTQDRQDDTIHHSKRYKRNSNLIWPTGIMESDSSQSAVLAKMYHHDYDHNSTNTRHVRLNDIVEIVGIVCKNHGALDEEEMKVQGSDIAYRSPYHYNTEELIHPLDMQDESNTIIPEIQHAYNQLTHVHVLYYKVIDMDSRIDPTSFVQYSEFTSRLCNTFEQDRSLAIETFTSYIFNGDTNAAEVLLLSLMSMAERDKYQNSIHLPDGATLGCASLQLIVPTVEAGHWVRTRLIHMLKMIMPVVACIDVTEHSLESPKESYLSIPEKIGTRLGPTSIQLPKGSCMIVDECKLDAEIRSQGYSSLTALSRIARDHCVGYNFHGIPFDFETDYVVIVISKEDDEEDMGDDDNVTFSGCTLRYRLTQLGDRLSSLPVVSDLVASRIRSYMRLCRKRDAISLSDQDLLSKAQNDFINRRNVRTTDTKPPVDEEDFHRWLTMTRLFARSHFKTAATSEDWESSLRLDAAIKNQ